jgi:hypothetical protein
LKRILKKYRLDKYCPFQQRKYLLFALKINLGTRGTFWNLAIENCSEQILPKPREFSAGMHPVNWNTQKPQEFSTGIAWPSRNHKNSQLKSILSIGSCGPGRLSATFGHHFFASVRPWSALSNFWALLFRFRAALVGSQQLLAIAFPLPCGPGRLSATFGHHFFASVRPWSALSNFWWPWPPPSDPCAALADSQQLLCFEFRFEANLEKISAQ